MAAGYGNAPGIQDLVFKLRAQFRETVCPVGIGSVGSGGIQHCHPVIFNEAHRFHGRSIGQAQKRHITAVQRLFSGFGIFSHFIGQCHQLQILPGREPLIDPQSGGTGAAINKDSFHVSYFPCFMRKYTHIILNMQPLYIHIQENAILIH